MLYTLLVMAGGAIGAALRFHAGTICAALLGPDWPWGTLFVNVSGGFAMGLLAGWMALRGAGAEPLRLFVGVGILGGFTTFSSFSLESVSMLARGEIGSALAYVALSVIASIGALALGLAATRLVAGAAA